ncbi:MAG: hypothetical protein V7647_2779 [Acidobacteriota bacterium]|jgi:lysophospholipase L1-like esterase
MFHTKFAAFTGAVLLMSYAGGGRAAEQWNYTALGDSLATGYLAQQGYVSVFEGYLQADNMVGVTLYNLAQNGSTSGRLLNSLRTDSVFRSAVLQSSVITWDIGLVDFKNARTTYKSGKCGKADNQDCLRSAVAAFNTNWDGIVVELLNARSVGNTVIRTMTIYNPWAGVDAGANTFADIKEPVETRGNDLQVLGYYLDQMNSHIATSSAHYGIPYANVYTAFNGTSGREDPVTKGYITSDGIHPTDSGHRLMADLLRAFGYAPLR